MQTLEQPSKAVPFYHYVCTKCSKPVKNTSAWFTNIGQVHYNCKPKE